MRKHIFKYLSIILILLMLTSCLSIIGKDMKNYVDLTGHQEGQVKFEQNYLIVFLEHRHYFKDGGKYLTHDLGIYNTVDNSKEIIISDCGNGVEDCFYYNNNLIIISETYQKGSCIKIEYYDLKKRKVISDLLIIPDNSAVEHDDIHDSFTNTNYYHVKSADFNRESGELILEIKASKGIASRNADFIRKFYKFENNSINEIFPHETQPDKDNDFIRGYNYRDEKYIFFIIKSHDIPWFNYKPKFEGLYVRRADINYHILKSRSGIYISSKPIWIEDGTKFIIGETLFDAEGSKHEKNIFGHTAKLNSSLDSYDIRGIFKMP